jgi:hypothetical protein
VTLTVSRFETVDPPQLVGVSPVPETLKVPASLRAIVTASPLASVIFTFAPTEAQVTAARAGMGKRTSNPATRKKTSHAKNLRDETPTVDLPMCQERFVLP